MTTNRNKSINKTPINRRTPESIFERLLAFINQHKLLFFFLFLILSGGLYILLRQRNQIKHHLDIPDFEESSHAKLALAMQKQKIPLSDCQLPDASLTLETLIKDTITIENDLAERLSKHGTLALKENVFQILIDNAAFPATREKMLRVFSSRGFNFHIKDINDEHHGAAAKYDGITHTITLLYSAIVNKVQLHGTLNHELHHADSHLASGRGPHNNDSPFTNANERAEFKQALEECNIATTENIYKLMTINASGMASKEERRLFNRIKHILKDYKPMLLGGFLPENESTIATMNKDLKNNKTVKYNNVYIRNIEEMNGQAIYWGHHAHDFTDVMQLIHAYVLDNDWHQNSVESMYANTAKEDKINPEDLALYERDAEIHAAPKAAAFFCPRLTLYHTRFRNNHERNDEIFDVTQSLK